MAKNNALRGVFLGGALLNEYPRVHAMIADLFDGSQAAAARRDRPDVPARRGRRRARYIESRQAFGRVVMSP